MRRLLWIDCLGGAFVGGLVLLLRSRLSPLYGLSEHLLWVLGVANLAYASYSFSLALCPRRPIPLLGVLVAANLVWSVLCFRWAVLSFSTATPFGLLHLIGEGVYVAALASLEWRWREVLSYK